jgi:hypothetical protein
LLAHAAENAKSPVEQKLGRGVPDSEEAPVMTMDRMGHLQRSD